jgi:hypothetical protein
MYSSTYGLRLKSITKMFLLTCNFHLLHHNSFHIYIPILTPNYNLQRHGFTTSTTCKYPMLKLAMQYLSRKSGFYIGKYNVESLRILNKFSFTRYTFKLDYTTKNYHVLNNQELFCSCIFSIKSDKVIINIIKRTKCASCYR